LLLQTLNEARIDTPVRVHGVPQEFFQHAKRARILERVGLTPQALARSIVEDVTALDATPRHGSGPAPRSGDSLVDVDRG